jgi:di/tricarboxylate transporter
MILFFTERFSTDAFSMGVMVLFLVTGGLVVSEGLAGFFNSATITVAAMFIISAALFNTGVMGQFSH